jgi:hypothetical protein
VNKKVWLGLAIQNPLSFICILVLQLFVVIFIAGIAGN